MAIRSVVVSDLSGKDIPEAKHARVLVEHPDIGFPVEIDISTDEAAKLQDTTLRLVTMTIYEPDAPVRTAVIETKVLDKLFPDVEIDNVLMGARKANAPGAASPRRARGAGGIRAGGERVDYSARDKFGQLHRGRVTDEEARLVREDREQASKNRLAQGHGPIDWNDDKEIRRYGLAGGS